MELFDMDTDASSDLSLAQVAMAMPEYEVRFVTQDEFAAVAGGPIIQNNDW